jgi:hypothetical protein
MKKYAVAYVNFFDNDLEINIIEAENERDAIVKGCKYAADYDDLPEGIDGIQELFWNTDILIEVKEII